MLHVTVPNLPETLTYSILGAIGLEILIAILLAVQGNALGVVLVLGAAVILYWFICRQLMAVVTAGSAAAANATLLFICALIDFITGLPYCGLLFLLAAIASGFVFVLLRQGGVPAELTIGGVIAVGGRNNTAHLRMLEELRDAGLLTADEFAAKQALLSL
jgi:hypothetical protein